MLDATPGAHLASAYRDGAALITEEILRQSELLPEVIMCPVGNGTTLAGIHSGFMRKVKFIPAHFGVTTVGNTLTGAGVGPYPFDWDVEPLRSTEPLDADVAREAVRQSGGGFLCVSLEEIRNATDRLRIHEGLSVHPAAAAVLAGWNALIERDGGFARKPTVLILTAQR
jgi:threonine synthase